MRAHPPRELQVAMRAAVHALELLLLGCCFDGPRLVNHSLVVGTLLPRHALEAVFRNCFCPLVPDFARLSFMACLLPFVVGLVVVVWLD